VDGEGARNILELYRPAEPAWIRDFRLNNIRLVTSSIFAKAASGIDKATAKTSLGIKWPPPLPSVLPAESPQNYIESDEFVTNGFSNWLATEFAYKMCVDANAVLWVETMPAEGNEWPKPKLRITPSKHVLTLTPDTFAIVTQEKDGKASGITVYTKTEMWQYSVNPVNGELATTNYAPSFWPSPVRTGGVTEDLGNDPVYHSFLAPMLPFLDQVFIDFSDLQAGIRASAHPEKWQYTQETCSYCFGSGFVESIKCVHCNGTGAAVSEKGPATSPFTNIILQPVRAGDPPPPVPPAGYIQKDIESLRFLEAFIENQKHEALASVHMEWANQSPVEQSGIAKMYDRSEYINFLARICRHVAMRVALPIIKGAIAARYAAVPNYEKMYPSADPSETFPVLGLDEMTTEIRAAREAGMDNAIIENMQMQFVSKKFASMPDARDYALLCVELDPFAGMTADAKTTAKIDGVITAEEYGLSVNIETLVRLALEEDKAFMSKPYKQKRQILLDIQKREGLINNEPAAVDGF
jgi:hypothetical protein